VSNRPDVFAAVVILAEGAALCWLLKMVKRVVR